MAVKGTHHGGEGNTSKQLINCILVIFLNISTKLQDEVYKMAIKLAMMYGAECWAVRKTEERKLRTTETRMLQWARGKTRLDHLERGTHVPDG